MALDHRGNQMSKWTKEEKLILERLGALNEKSAGDMAHQVLSASLEFDRHARQAENFLLQMKKDLWALAQAGDREARQDFKKIIQYQKQIKDMMREVRHIGSSQKFDD